MAVKIQSNTVFSISQQKKTEEKEVDKIMHIKVRDLCPEAIRHFPNGLQNM